MFDITREGSKTTIKVETSIGWSYNTSINCNDEPYEILLAQNLRNKMYEGLTQIRKEAYEQGWKDKSRKQRKEDWFAGNWKPVTAFL